MSEWRTIDTAPTDGVEILAGLFVRNRRTGRTGWEASVIWTDDETGEIHPDAYRGWDWSDYTHWQPLPDPPASPPESSAHTEGG